MADSKPTAREVAIDLAGFKEAVAPQFKWLNQLIYWLGAVMLAMVGGGFALYAQIGDIKATTARIEERVTAANERLAAATERLIKLEQLGNATAATLSKLEQTNATIAASLNRIDVRTANMTPYTGGPLDLVPGEESIIRAALGLDRLAGKGTTRVKVGDPMPATAVQPLPNSLVEKVPKLRGLKFTIDGGSAIIVDAANHVVAVINPT